MKKLKQAFGIVIIIYIVSIFFTLTSCKNETKEEILTSPKVFIQVDAVSNDGTINSSAITIVE